MPLFIFMDQKKSCIAKNYLKSSLLNVKIFREKSRWMSQNEIVSRFGLTESHGFYVLEYLSWKT